MIQRKLILSHHDKEIEFLPGSGTFTIGRAKDNDLVLNFDYVSRYHGRMVREKDKLIYVDRYSTNGTYIALFRI
ncbi:MAG TPA: FHA domain-containing protein [Syntrophaceae bacterium]|nr:FHA domain-containing protein [Syntrophaceae bacterium]